MAHNRRSRYCKQGFAGGNGYQYNGTFSDRNGAGGGGAGSVGTTGSTSQLVAGGYGVIVPITGTTVGYAGGGGGANSRKRNTKLLQVGGTGAGANGQHGTSGAANTGGGGGGGGEVMLENGGSGVVILRMNTSDYSGATTGSPTVTTNGSETILTYTGSGTYVHS